MELAIPNTDFYGQQTGSHSYQPLTIPTDECNEWSGSPPWLDPEFREQCWQEMIVRKLWWLDHGVPYCNTDILYNLDVLL